MIFIALKIIWICSPATAEELVNAISLPAGLQAAAAAPWSLISYACVHLNFMHLLVNSLWLAWFGALLERTAGSRFTIACYAAGAITGAAAFLIAGAATAANNNAILIGASASTFAVITATLIAVPDRKDTLPLLGRLPIKWIAAAGLVFFIAASTGMSAAQTAAHAGGLLSGAALATAWKIVSRRRMEVMKARARQQMARNRIIEKARKSGYTSLSRAERVELFNTSANSVTTRTTAN